MTEMTSATLSQVGEGVDGGLEGRLARPMGDDHEVRALTPGLGVGRDVLAHCLDRDSVCGEGRRDLGEDARTVLDIETDVIARRGGPKSSTGRSAYADSPGPRPPATCAGPPRRGRRGPRAVGSPPAPRP